jgi:hypothetical protein
MLGGSLWSYDAAFPLLISVLLIAILGRFVIIAYSRRNAG